MDSTAPMVAASIITSLPLVVAWLICVLFAVAKWKERSTAAKLVVAVCVLSFIDLVCGQIYFQAIVPMLYRDSGMDFDNLGYMMGFLGFCRSIFHAFLFCLLVWAAFSKSTTAKDEQTFT